MSLKELISTLIESVFTSKKSYIATQCLPNGNAVYQEFADTKSSTTAPFSDGCESKHIVAGCKVVQTVFSLLLQIKTKIGHVCLYLYKKGKPSIGMLKGWSKEMLICGLSTTKQTNNLATEVCHG